MQSRGCPTQTRSDLACIIVYRVSQNVGGTRLGGFLSQGLRITVVFADILAEPPFFPPKPAKPSNREVHEPKAARQARVEGPAERRKVSEFVLRV